jgi:hypothetical protein
VEDLIASIVATAVRDLAAGLSVYWPSERNNEMAEAHAVAALGRAFDRAGFHVFHEVQCRTAGNVGHIDLLALSVARSACVAVEGKRLYDGNGAEAVLVDWERLGNTRLANEHGFPALDHHYRMLLTTSWQENIREWWLGNAEVPSRRRDVAWGKLREATGNAHMNGSLIQWDPHWGEQWLLYAYDRRSACFFSGGPRQ